MQNNILFIRNLPFKITGNELYELFGKYGAIRQIRIGDAQDTKGTAFIVFEQLVDANNALKNLSGFNLNGRYLIVLYHNSSNQRKRKDM